MAKVKYLKKFKKYNMRVENGTIYLICKEDDVLERDVELKDNKLIKDTLKVGKTINDTINLFYKEEINKIKEKFTLLDIDKKDIDNLRLHKEFIFYNKDDLINMNESIIEFIKKYVYYKEPGEVIYTTNFHDDDMDMDMKDIISDEITDDMDMKDIISGEITDDMDMKDIISNEITDDMDIRDIISNEITDDMINIIFDEITDINFFYNTYRETYNLLKDNGVNVDKLCTPSDIMDLLKWDTYSIEPPKETKKSQQNVDQPTISDRKNEEYINNQFKYLLKLLEENKENINYTSLISEISYIPLNMKDFFTHIMENNPNNKYTHKVADEIFNYVNTYGVPFWTEDIDIPKSTVDYSCIDIPLNNFIFICLSIYVYFELWNFFNKYHEKYDTFEEINFLNQALNILNIDYLYTDEKKDLLDKLGKSIKELDININHKYNKIFDYILKIYRDRIWKKKEKIFTVEYIYENYIIGVWDIFFMYYFGSDNSLTRIERHFCTECHKEFIGKGHIKKTLCDSCYDIRQKNLLKKRVEKFREKSDK